MTHPGIQDKLFDSILSRYAQRAEAVADLCQVLHLAKDPVYRRLRGDTQLSPEEIALLARHYRLSIDTLIYGDTTRVLCNFNGFARRITNFSQYLEDLSADLEQMRRLPGAHLYYATVEIPLLTYSFVPELLGFKLYVWGKTTWNLDFLRNRSFSFDLLDAQVLKTSRELLDHYLAIDSTELWTLNIFDNTLAQLENLVYSGGFRENADALLVCDKIVEWAEHMKALTAAGKKFRVGEKPIHGSGAMLVYNNEMLHTNNTALLTSDITKGVYSAFCNPNFIQSTDPKLCDYTEDWFKSVIERSTPLSSNTEMARDAFFLTLTRKAERSRQRITAFYDDHDA